MVVRRPSLLHSLHKAEESGERSGADRMGNFRGRLRNTKPYPSPHGVFERAFKWCVYGSLFKFQRLRSTWDWQIIYNLSLFQQKFINFHPATGGLMFLIMWIFCMRMFVFLCFKEISTMAPYFCTPCKCPSFCNKNKGRVEGFFLNSPWLCLSARGLCSSQVGGALSDWTKPTHFLLCAFPGNQVLRPVWDSG